MSGKPLHICTGLGMLCLLSLSLLLGGCMGLGETLPVVTPTPTEYLIPLAPTFPPPPSVPCDKAVQLIQQKQVSVVTFWYTPQGDFFGIDIKQLQATPVAGKANSYQDADVYTPRGPYHYDPDAQCIAQIRAAVKQVNSKLPTTMQVKIVRMTTYGG